MLPLPGYRELGLVDCGQRGCGIGANGRWTAGGVGPYNTYWSRTDFYFSGNRVPSSLYGVISRSNILKKIKINPREILPDTGTAYTCNTTADASKTAYRLNTFRNIKPFLI